MQAGGDRDDDMESELSFTPSELQELEQLDTRGQLDGSFASFVNPTDTLADEDCRMEVIFTNASLFKIIGENASRELNSFIQKPMFHHSNVKQPLSLIQAVQKRFSDFILS